jgi:hypothetical protein
MAHYIYSLFPSITTKHFLRCPSKLGRTLQQWDRMYFQLNMSTLRHSIEGEIKAYHTSMFHTLHISVTTKLFNSLVLTVTSLQRSLIQETTHHSTLTLF